MNNKHATYGFYDTVAPVILTETQTIKPHTQGWGVLTEYYVESVKINNRKNGISSVAVLKIGDISGQTILVIRGQSVCLLFGLTVEEWKEVEKMCQPGQQLYYRYFKNGISLGLCHEQKLFYNFCATNTQSEVLAAKFVKCINTRSNFNHESLLEVSELQKCDMHLLDLYISHLRKSDTKKSNQL